MAPGKTGGPNVRLLLSVTFTSCIFTLGYNLANGFEIVFLASSVFSTSLISFIPLRLHMIIRPKPEFTFDFIGEPCSTALTIFQ